MNAIHPLSCNVSCLTAVDEAAGLTHGLPAPELGDHVVEPPEAGGLPEDRRGVAIESRRKVKRTLFVINPSKKTCFFKVAV